MDLRLQNLAALGFEQIAQQLCATEASPLFLLVIDHLCDFGVDDVLEDLELCDVLASLLTLLKEVQLVGQLWKGHFPRFVHIVVIQIVNEVQAVLDC